GGTRPRDGVTVHRASGLYAHVTWHTYRRMRTIRKYDVAAIVEAVLYDLVLCATRQVRVLAARERGAEGRAATANGRVGITSARCPATMCTRRGLTSHGRFSVTRNWYRPD